ncbi:hypothetical protein JCM16303_003173 [Sporobolomyces ruberrimus]
MCIPRATIAYGLTIRSASLVFAVDAWSRLEKTFPFFDLILLRRRSRNLEAFGSVNQGAVMRVPQEIWEDIRFWLVRQEVADSEDAILRHIVCDTPRFWAARPPSVERMSWSERHVNLDCYLCFEAYCEWLRDHLANWDKTFVAASELFLLHFGLALGCQTPIPTLHMFEEENTLALVTVRNRLERGESNSPAIVTAKCGGDSEPDEHTIVDVSFELPSNVDQRFKHLVRLFNLEVVDSSIDTISSVPGEVATAEEWDKATSVKSSGVANKVTNDIRPRWLLWTTSQSE